MKKAYQAPRVTVTLKKIVKATKKDNNNVITDTTTALAKPD